MADLLVLVGGMLALGSGANGTDGRVMKELSGMNPDTCAPTQHDFVELARLEQYERPRIFCRQCGEARWIEAPAADAELSEAIENAAELLDQAGATLGAANLRAAHRKGGPRLFVNAGPVA